jgi:uracil-DNA glycosylase
MILGEAPGETEAKKGLPFVGASGQELSRMLSEAMLDESQVYMTNVLWTRPPSNNFDAFLVPSKEKASLPTSYALPPIRSGSSLGYLHPSLLPELNRLYEEILQVQPNLILAMGNKALWALTGRENISSVRGTITTIQSSAPVIKVMKASSADGSSMLPPPTARESSFPLDAAVKILPTFHPAAILRSWELRPIVLADILKASRQSQFPEIRRPSRKVLINPSLECIRTWTNEALSTATLLACDVETRRGQITEIGFAKSPSEALVVPFIRGEREHYWSTPAEEIQAHIEVRRLLDSPIPKVFQNGLYDVQYIWKTLGLPPRNFLHDTMLKHHAEFPELQKGLGFLGSIYTDEPAWKLMRIAAKDDHQKRDDE